MNHITTEEVLRRRRRVGVRAIQSEAVATGSPFRTGPLRTLADMEALTTDYIDWYNNQRLHSLLGNATPDEFEHACYAHQTGSPTGEAANEKTA